LIKIITLTNLHIT